MKKVIIGGECPEGAVNISKLIKMSVSGNTYKWAVEHYETAYIESAEDILTILKYAPLCVEEGKRGLILFVYATGEGISQYLEDIYDAFTDIDKTNPSISDLIRQRELEIRYFGHSNINVEHDIVCVPVERYRPAGDITSFADADNASKKWLAKSSVVMTGTNLRLEYILNRMMAIDNFDFVRIVVLPNSDKQPEAPEYFGGKMKKPTEYAYRSQCYRKGLLRHALPKAIEGFRLNLDFIAEYVGNSNQWDADDKADYRKKIEKFKDTPIELVFLR